MSQRLNDRMTRYRFGPYSLDVESFRLRRGEAEIHLQPQVFELLRYLVANPGRLIGKDELVEEVWEGRFVTDTALTRAISDARRALDDDARDPDYIATVHGRGYRFVAEVERESGSRVGEGEHGAPDVAADEAPRRRGWRLVLATAALVALVVVVVVVLVAVEGPEDHGAESRAGLSNRTPPPRLAILPPSSSGSSSNLLGLAVADLLVTRLQASPLLDVVPPERAAALIDEAPSLAEFGARTGSDWAIELVIEPVGSTTRNVVGDATEADRYVLATTLYRLLEGDGIERFRFGTHELRRPDDDLGLETLLAAREQIVRQLVDQILPAIDVGLRDGLTPNDAQAYRLYITARDRLRAGGCRDALIASELLDRALERDPEFAPAWEHACVARHSAMVVCGWSVEGERSVTRACDRAVELAPDLPSAVAAKAIVLTETGAVEEAYEIVFERRNAGDSHPLLAQIEAFVLRYAGFLHRAERIIEELVAQNPSWYVVHLGKPNTLLYLGRHQRYLELLPHLESPMYRYYRGWVEWRSGSREAAIATLEPAFRSDPGDQFARLSEALLAIIESRPQEARLIVEQLARERQRRSAVDGEMSFKLAELLALAGAGEGAIAQLDRAVEQGFFCSLCMARSPVFSAVADSPTFEAVVGHAQRRHLAFADRFGLEPETLD